MFYPVIRENSGKRKRQHRQTGQQGVLVAALLSLFFLLPVFSYSQGMPFPPPNQMEVYGTQGLNFGSFYVGATGGTVEISPTGGRIVSGDVQGFLTEPGGPAVFIIRLIPGRLVHIVFDDNPVPLIRNGSGETITISLFKSDKPNNQFVTTGGQPFHNPVQIGGTLQVGGISANPPGNYQGFFTVTFIQE